MKTKEFIVEFDNSGKIQTVLGPSDPKDMGITLAGESIFIDLSMFRGPPTEAYVRGLYNQPISSVTLSEQRFYGIRNFQQLRLGNINEAIESVMLYKQWGGQTIVDNSSIGLGRDPIALSRVSRATGVSIIMGASYYAIRSHPPEIQLLDEKTITEKITNEVIFGVGSTGIKPGALGETGLTSPVSENELKVLRATASASIATGAPLVIHPAEENEGPLHHIQTLKTLGMELSNVIMCHVDTRTDDVLTEIAQSGCYMRFEGFTEFGRPASPYSLTYSGTSVGNETPTSMLARGAPGTDANLARIISLFERGYGEQVLICTDINGKERLQQYGGHGYQFILENVVTRMRHLGFTKKIIKNLLVDNPARAFTFDKPNLV